MRDCCAAAAGRQLTPWACFQRGLETLRQPPWPLQGEAVATVEGRQAGFSLQLADGRVQDLRFSCTHCTTLIACCQALAELNRGCALAAPRVHEAARLQAHLPGLPASKQACAVLAVAALRAALLAADASIPLSKEST